MNVPVSAILSGVCAIAALSSEVSFGQDRDNAEIRFSPTDYVLQMLPNMDLVAVGEFGTPVELGDDEISLLRSRELDLAFTIETVYKGGVLPGEVVQIRLRSDMLVYPGESISRYEMRPILHQVKAERLRRVVDEMDLVRKEAEDAEELFDAGEISRQERDARIADVDARVREIDQANRQVGADSMESLRIQRTMIVSHGTTFYEIGGSIEPDTPYLIAANAIDGNIYYYSLSERHSSVIWGELAEDIVATIEQQ